MLTASLDGVIGIDADDVAVVHALRDGSLDAGASLSACADGVEALPIASLRG